MLEWVTPKWLNGLVRSTLLTKLSEPPSQAQVVKIEKEPEDEEKCYGPPEGHMIESHFDRVLVCLSFYKVRLFHGCATF